MPRNREAAGQNNIRRQQHNSKHAGGKSFISIIRAVRKNCKQSQQKRHLMLLLATYCDRCALCYPKDPTLANQMDVSPRTIRRMLHELERDGELRRFKWGGKRWMELLHY